MTTFERPELDDWLMRSGEVLEQAIRLGEALFHAIENGEDGEAEHLRAEEDELIHRTCPDIAGRDCHGA